MIMRVKGINVITDRRDPENEETLSEAANRWFSLAKNIVWIIGIVTVASFYVSNNNNTNAQQDDKIKQSQIDIGELRAAINAINKSQTDQLVILTKLVTIAENNRDNAKKAENR